MADLFDMSPLTARVLGTILVIIVIVVVRTIAAVWVSHRVSDVESQFRARKALTYVATLLTIIALTFIWLPFIDGLATFLGLLSAGLAIALADVFLNLAGWVYIVFRRPFKVGDRIEIAGDAGDVVDIRAFRFTLLEIRDWVDADQSTGRILHVPNGRLFREPMANFTEGFPYVWHEIPMLVTFESDWRAAEAMMKRALATVAIPEDEARRTTERVSAARDYRVSYSQLTPTTYVSTRDSGVLITGRILVEARSRRGVDDAVWRSLLDAIDGNDHVDLAYPTIRGYVPGVGGSIDRQGPDSSPR